VHAGVTNEDRTCDESHGLNLTKRYRLYMSTLYWVSDQVFDLFVSLQVQALLILGSDRTATLLLNQRRMCRTTWRNLHSEGRKAMLHPVGAYRVNGMVLTLG
jgi:hypothetical protein